MSALEPTFASPERERRYIRWALSPSLKSPSYSHIRDPKSLRSAHFSAIGHQVIWEAVESEMARSGRLWLSDVRTACLANPRAGKAASSLLSDLTYDSMTQGHAAEVPADVAELADLAVELREMYDKRIRLKALEYARQAAADDNLDGLERALAAVAKIGEESGRVEVYETPENIGQAYLAQMKRMEQGVTRQRTGFSTLDYAFGDLGRQSLWIIGGTTGSGKSSLALSVAMKLAHAGERGAWISLEDSSDVVGRRLAAMECGVDISDDHKIEAREQHAIGLWINKHEQQKLVRFYYPLNLGMNEVVAAIRSAKEHGAKWVVVDYLQAIYQPVGVERRNFIRDVVARLKAECASKDMNLILLSQLSRDKDNPFTEPTNNRLKESGDIEDKAELISLMWKNGDEEDSKTLLKVTKVKWSARRPRGEVMRDTLGTVVNVLKVDKDQQQSNVLPFNKNRSTP